MARLPAWAVDPEQPVSVAQGAGDGASRFKRIALGLAVVGVATFAGGYYVPLYRAHEALTIEQRALAQKLESVESTNSSLKRELDEVTSARSELLAERERRAGEAKAAEDKILGLERELASKLEKFVTKGNVVVTVSQGRVVVGVAESAVFVPSKSDVSPKGKLLLCELAKAAGERQLSLTAVATEAPALFDSVWKFTTARAADAALTLESRCKVPAERLVAGGSQGASSPEKLGALSGRLEIAVVP